MIGGITWGAIYFAADDEPSKEIFKALKKKKVRAVKLVCDEPVKSQVHDACSLIYGTKVRSLSWIENKKERKIKFCPTKKMTRNNLGRVDYEVYEVKGHSPDTKRMRAMQGTLLNLKARQIKNVEYGQLMDIADWCCNWEENRQDSQCVDFLKEKFPYDPTGEGHQDTREDGTSGAQ